MSFALRRDQISTATGGLIGLIYPQAKDAPIVDNSRGKERSQTFEFDSERRELTTKRGPFSPSRTIVITETLDTVYTATPFLGVDQLIWRAQQQFPHWRFLHCRFLIQEDGSAVLQLRKKLLSGWSEATTGLSLADVLLEHKPTVLGISSMSKEWHEQKAILQECAPLLTHTVVAAGGAHATRAARELLTAEYAEIAPLVDIVFEGESVDSFIRLVSHLDEYLEENIELLPALLARLPNTVVPVREAERTIDSPVVIYRNVRPPGFLKPTEPVPPEEQRTEHWYMRGRRKVLVFRVMSQQGCQFNCSFCSVPVSRDGGPRWIAGDLRLLQSYLRSVEDYTHQLGLKREDVLVFFEDGNLGDKRLQRPERRFAEELLRMTKNRDLNLGFQIRYDTLSDESFVELLSADNASYLFTSVETISPKVMSRMWKGERCDPELIYEVYHRLDRLGIEYSISTIAGHTGDTMEDRCSTWRFVKLLGPTNVWAEIAKVYPGTRDADEYLTRTGINPGLAYSRGHSLSRNRNGLGPENVLALFQHLSENEAIESLLRFREIMTNDQYDSSFGLQPIRPVRYHQVGVGFVHDLG